MSAGGIRFCDFHTMSLQNGIRAAIPLEKRSILSANQYLVAWRRRVTHRTLGSSSSTHTTANSLCSKSALRCCLSFSGAIPIFSSLAFAVLQSFSQSFESAASLSGPVKSHHYSWMHGCLSWHSSAPTCTGSPTQRAWQLSAPRPQPASSASALVSSSSLSLHLITSNMIETKLLFPHAARESMPISLPNDPCHTF